LARYRVRCAVAAAIDSLRAVALARAIIAPMSTLHGPNVIEVAGSPLLLTSTSGGSAVHLTSVKRDGEEGREALPDYFFTGEVRNRSVETLRGYDRIALVEPIWSDTTLCGRDWAIMVGGDGGDVSGFGEVAFAPTCRRCLALIDRHFPAPSADGRMALVASLAADVVLERRGFVEVHGVPGDQQDQLRKAIRAIVRTRTGQSMRTSVSGGVVHGICQAIYDSRSEEAQQEIRQHLEYVWSDTPIPREERYWIVDWEAWDRGD
jgi:hypothetical protein